jgi:CMP-N-acetylneuraminic acid synthetase
MSRFVIEIPARMGSKRVKQKNLRLLSGKPMIWYAIDAAKQSGVSEIYVNSESEVIGKFAEKSGVKFYRRNQNLAEDTVTSDTFNYDFVKNIKPDVLVMVNPVSPLITGPDIDAAIAFYQDGGYDTVITAREEHLQAFCENKPVNFNPNGILPMTQNIPPVVLCAWSICIWRTTTFVESFEKNGYAVFSGKVGFFPLHPLKCIKISSEEDFRMAEALMEFQKKEISAPQYFEL